MLVTTTTGQENFPNCGCKVYLFVVPSIAVPGTRKEKHVAYAAKEGEYGIRRNGGTQITPAAPAHIDEYGKWYRTTFDVPENVVLKVFAQRKTAAQIAGRHQNQAVFLRMREGAPLHRITVRTTGSDIGQYNTVHTEGRFDVLTMDELTRLGVIIHPVHRGYLDDNGLISVEVVSPATASAPVVRETVVQNQDGQDVVIRRTRPGRALDL